MGDLTDRLRYNSGLMSICGEAADEIDRLTARVAVLEQDAARYVYLREKCPWTVCVDGEDGRTATVSLHVKVSKDLIVAEGEDDFDAAIDAAAPH